MFTNNFAKLMLIPLIILLVACGSSPVTTTQPVAQVNGQNVAAVENVSVETAVSPQENTVAPATVEVVAVNNETAVSAPPTETNLTYPIVDTNQAYCYNNSSSITCPNEGEAFYGQDAQYTGNNASYTNNGDGTVTDNVTGLMWQQNPGEKMTYDQAVAGASAFSMAGYDDWRLPTIKELYSLIQHSGTDYHPCVDNGSCTLTPFIDTDYFDFSYGDTNSGERIIDSQWATSTKYVSTTMNGDDTMFGVNFADGRVKGYGTDPMPGQSTDKKFFVIYVRGNESYGINDFVDNGDGTIADQATGLTWMQSDSNSGLNWEESLSYCSTLNYAGNTDWRLPDAKELHSIVDYGRSPDSSNSAAIDPIFNVSTFTNEAGELDYPSYWSSTTHKQASGNSPTAVYISFGRSMGYMNGSWLDVHGAGAQRSEQKSGNPADYATGHGPQGDAVHIYNYVRCVTDGSSGEVQVGGATDSMPVIEEQQPPAGQDGVVSGGQPQNDGQPPQIDFTSAAAQLGVSEQALMNAMGEPGQGPPNFTTVANQLGVTEQALITALGIPAGEGQQQPPPSN